LVSSIFSTIFENDSGSARVVIKKICDIVNLAFDNHPTRFTGAVHKGQFKQGELYLCFETSFPSKTIISNSKPSFLLENNENEKAEKDLVEF